MSRNQPSVPTTNLATPATPPQVGGGSMMKKGLLFIGALVAIYFLYRYFTKDEGGPSKEEAEHMAVMDQMRQQQMMEREAQYHNEERARYEEEMRQRAMEEQMQEREEREEGPNENLPPRPATQ